MELWEGPTFGYFSRINFACTFILSNEILKIHDFKEYKEGFRETKFPDIPEKGKRKETRKERDMGRINSNFILLIT